MEDLRLTNNVGAKFDGGKLLFSLLTRGLALPLKSVVAVLTYGAAKYAAESWKDVPEGARRYEDALDRHLNAWKAGETHDDESGLHHLAHAACNILFMVHFEMHKRDGMERNWFRANDPKDTGEAMCAPETAYGKDYTKKQADTLGRYVDSMIMTGKGVIYND